MKILMPQIIRRVGVLVLLTLLVWLAVIVAQGLFLVGHAVRLSVLAASPGQIRIAETYNEVHGLRAELAALRITLAPVLWLGARIGGDLSVAEPLADAGIEAINAADESFAALTPTMGDLSLSSLSMSAIPKLLDGLVSARPALDRASVRLDRASNRVGQIDCMALSPRVAGWVAKVDGYLRLAQQGIGAAQVAPDLLGRDGPRTYLVLVQNSDELRPTGGFISNYGRIEINAGKIISQTFQDSYSVDDFSKEYPYPPKPIMDYMSIDQWVFRDANWSPDFPTSVRTAIQLYQITHPEKIDGVISVNLKAIPLLMAGLAPLRVEGLAAPVTADNALDLFQDAWNPSETDKQNADWWGWYYKRKQTVGAFVRAAIEKMSNGKPNWAKLGLGTMDGLQQRQIAIYSAGVEGMRLSQLRWDGAVRQEAGDYLMVVDANIGYAKVASLIHQTIGYWVTLDDAGRGRGQATIEYVHRGTKPNVECTPMVSYVLDQITYEQTVNRCLADYVRLMVPQGSRLRGASEHPVPGKYLLSGKPTDGKPQVLPEEAGRTAFAKFFVVEYGKSLVTNFDYDLPTVVGEQAGLKHYSLLVQKQSGTEAIPFKLTVTLPPQARWVAVNPPFSAQNANVLFFELALNTDRQITVDYELAR